MIRIYTTGRHAHRSPISYPALRPLFADHITFVDEPAQADLCVFAHVIDIQEAPPAVAQDWRARRRPVVLLSEEPFWDTIWGGQPLDREIYVETDYGPLPVHQINHHTSDVFDFDRLPYYLLTNPRFADHYGTRFGQNAALEAADWHARFAARPTDLTYMFERRSETYHNVEWPQGDIIGLCAWRTELAQNGNAGRASFTIERLGPSWHGGLSRLDMDTDWHLDKLTRLDNQTRLLGALENTHQPNYITEKFFDAFACGALPVYYASAGHHIHDFGLPPASWINLYGQTPAFAAARLREPDWPARMAAFAQAQQILADLFCPPVLWQTEPAHLAGKVLATLRAQLS